MNAVSQILGALIEAWGEVKVQKARVVLSLVGVVAAVAAMTIVIALGDLLLQSSRELTELYGALGHPAPDPRKLLVRLGGAVDGRPLSGRDRPGRARLVRWWAECEATR